MPSIYARCRPQTVKEVWNDPPCADCARIPLKTRWQKTISPTFVFPLVLGMNKAQLTGPLSQFQITVVDEPDMQKLLMTLREQPMLRVALAQQLIARRLAEIEATRRVDPTQD